MPKGLSLQGNMQRLIQEDSNETAFVKNIRLRSKLTLILKRKKGITGKLVDKQIGIKAKEAVKEENWIESRTANVGKTLQGLPTTERKMLQKKAGTFYSLHQLLHLKSTQMSNSYRKESRRICFDPIDIQLRRFHYNSVQELNHKGSLSSQTGTGRRMLKLDMKDRALSSLDDRYKLVKSGLAATSRHRLALESEARTSPYHSSLKTFSIRSKIQSLSTLTTDDFQDKSSKFGGSFLCKNRNDRPPIYI